MMPNMSPNFTLRSPNFSLYQLEGEVSRAFISILGKRPGLSIGEKMREKMTFWGKSRYSLP
jgi:hypothetical protein